MKTTPILKELKKYASAERRKASMWFFKTGKGQYGEGDEFIGVSNPDARKVAGKFAELNSANFPALKKLLKQSLASAVHEERLVALLILVYKYEKLGKARNLKDMKDAKKSAEVRRQIAKFYLQNLDRVNNWDLVDLSAHKIVGQAILDGVLEEKILDKLVISKNMWHRRVAIIATMAFIRAGKFASTLRIAQKMLGDGEDLSHKAVGWALREVWKRDAKLCEKFLIDNYSHIPRTTLRYAIERMPEPLRLTFLHPHK